ncbi:branched-subunit amino acid transport protein [Humitalea rosea]|uniref:Branched-subunit amino acid transport protein n=1 Tax=Humitalea rosea TaxID=990373 RepID=A0A2W7I417_9PROT|nr:AzlD domain-containing protein [Humitalea rosea]PZW41058.1 branched-subunit amino acid transport protein [Humitalea rosea]
MMLRSDVLLAILGMAAVTYLCRAGGYAALRAMRPPPFVERLLQYLPGCLFVAYVVPGVAQLGLAGWAAAVACVLVQARTRNYALSAVAGVGTVWLLRLAGQ